MTRTLWALTLVGCVPSVELGLEALPAGPTVIIEREGAPTLVIDRRASEPVVFLAAPERAHVYAESIEELQLEPGPLPRLETGRLLVGRKEILEARQEGRVVEWVEAPSDVEPPTVPPFDRQRCRAAGGCTTDEVICSFTECEPEAAFPPTLPVSLDPDGGCMASGDFFAPSVPKCPALQGPFAEDHGCVLIGDCVVGGVTDLAAAIATSSAGAVIELGAGTFDWPSGATVPADLQVRGRCPEMTILQGNIDAPATLSNLSMRAVSISDAVNLSRVQVSERLTVTANASLAVERSVLRGGLFIEDGSVLGQALSVYGRGVECVDGGLDGAQVDVHGENGFAAVHAQQDCTVEITGGFLEAEGVRVANVGGGGKLTLINATVQGQDNAPAIIVSGDVTLREVALMGGASAVQIGEGNLENGMIEVELERVLIDAPKSSGITGAFSSAFLTLRVSNTVMRLDALALDFRDETIFDGPITLDVDDLCIDGLESMSAERQAGMLIEGPIGGHLERVWIRNMGEIRFESSETLTLGDLTVIEPDRSSVELKGLLDVFRLRVAAESSAGPLVRTGHTSATPQEVNVEDLIVEASTPGFLIGLEMSRPVPVHRFHIRGVETGIELLEPRAWSGGEVPLTNGELEDLTVGIRHGFPRDPLLERVKFDSVAQEFVRRE